MMGRLILYIGVLISVFWSIYAGYELVVNSKTRYAPEFVFTTEDQGVLLVRKVNELKLGDFIKLSDKNPFSREVENIENLNLGKISYFLSAERALILLEKKAHWKKSEISNLKKAISRANTSIVYDGPYALLSQDIDIVIKNTSSFDFADGDKKASANFWNLSSPENIVRTDIYALNRGYFRYKSSKSGKKFGESIADSDEFSTVLPQTIEKYEFFERFYAAEQDTVYANSPLSEWVDKGFVVAEFNNQLVLVSDYRAQQTPSLVLMEKATNADSIILDSEIKLFKGVRLSRSFPKNPNPSFYLFEIEDKVLFTESLELAKKIQIAYQMGETLGLNQVKSEQFFSGLPTKTNYRKVEHDSKKSITFKKNLQFEVTTIPPGEQLINYKTTNWTNSQLTNYAGFEPIADHLRGGHSLFAFNKEGDFVLLNNNGDVEWKGSADTSIIDAPQIIDIFENGKQQILFTTHKSVYLIDLNGKNVGSFPYQSDYYMTSSVSYFRWKNTTCFLVGNSKGELVMLNTSGSELNIIKASSTAIKNTAFALNINSNLRGWCIDDTNEKRLTYLEAPIKTEKLAVSTATKFERSGGEVFGYLEADGNVYVESMQQSNRSLISEGQLIPINTGLALKKNNFLSLFNKNHQLIQTIDLGFNEVLSAFVVSVKSVNYIFVLDYFKNNIYCYNNNGELINGFPKEGSSQLKASYNESSNELNIYTIISNSVVCHKIKLAKNS